MTDIAVGTQAWFERRKHIWTWRAEDLRDQLQKYEDEHPDDAPCLMRALLAAQEAVE